MCMQIAFLFFARLLPEAALLNLRGANSRIRCMLDANSLPGACPRIRMCRVPSAAWADARRRDAGDVGASSRSANEADAHAPPEPFGRKGLACDIS
jgi:hypothetical protein